MKNFSVYRQVGYMEYFDPAKNPFVICYTAISSDVDRPARTYKLQINFVFPCHLYANVLGTKWKQKSNRGGTSICHVSMPPLGNLLQFKISSSNFGDCIVGSIQLYLATICCHVVFYALPNSNTRKNGNCKVHRSQN